MSTTNQGGWIGVDLDGTLALHEKWVSHKFIGRPIEEMVERVKGWRADGWEVRIFTARIFPLARVVLSNEDLTPMKALPGYAPAVEAVEAIQNWSWHNLGEVLPITCVKDMKMVELWDDRCVQVVRNTGEVLGQSFLRPFSKKD